MPAVPAPNRAVAVVVVASVDGGADMADWVELRVHGVSGTPPEDMLATPHVCQVAGDDRSRSFRPTDALGSELPGADGQVLEAFHWGRWTSGSWKQALWLLLIPFGMVNAAQFMLPAPTHRAARWAHALCGAALRLLAFVLTVLFAVVACVVVVDLLAWQWLSRRDIPVSDVVVIVAALLLAALVNYLLSTLGQTYRGARYRFAGAPSSGTGVNELPGLSSPAFFDGDPDSPSLRFLHRAAGLAVVAWIGLTVADRVGPGWADGLQWIGTAILVGTAVVLSLLGDPELTTSLSGPEGRGLLLRLWHGEHVPGDRWPRGFSGHLAWGLLALSVGALGLAAVAVATSAPGTGGLVAEDADTGLPGMDSLAAVTGIAGTFVVLVLLLSVAVLAVLTSGTGTSLHVFRRFAWGMTAAYAASVGFFVGLGLTAGLALAVQGALNRLRDDVPDRVEEALGDSVAEEAVPGAVATVTAPPVLQRVSYAWGLTAAVILGLLVLAVVKVYLRRRSVFRARVAAAMEFGDVEESRLPPRWIGRVVHAMRLARLKNHLVLVFTTFAVAGTLFSLAAAVGHERRNDGLLQMARWLERWDWLGWLSGWLTSLNRWTHELWTWPGFLTGVASRPGDPVTADDLVIGVGQFLLLGLASGAVLLARGAIKAEGARRGLNVVWDVIAFWPRSVHPFVPPPYAQEVVPALVRRICWLLGEKKDPLVELGDGRVPRRFPTNPEPADHVVLAAHSQGSLISLAALLWLPAHVQPKVSWLTFGSQLRQQFPRAFPHYVRVDDLVDVQKRHRWLSLYRDTDPIAGPVTSWCHSPDDTVPQSRRLHSPDEWLDDEIDPQTGRRQCGAEWRLLDPTPNDRHLQRRAVADISGHSNYWTAPDWRRAVWWVRQPIPPDRWVVSYPPAGGLGPTSEEVVSARAVPEATDGGCPGQTDMAGAHAVSWLPSLFDLVKPGPEGRRGDGAGRWPRRFLPRRTQRARR